MYHVIFKCPLYASIRDTWLSKYEFPRNECEYLRFFADPEHAKIKDVNVFVMSMLEIRDRTMNEEHNLDRVNYNDM
jgi:hypothetical protein